MAALNNAIADGFHAAGEVEASRAALIEAIELFAKIAAEGVDPCSREMRLHT